MNKLLDFTAFYLDQQVFSDTWGRMHKFYQMDKNLMRENLDFSSRNLFSFHFS